MNQSIIDGILSLLSVVSVDELQYQLEELADPPSENGTVNVKVNSLLRVFARYNSEDIVPGLVEFIVKKKVHKLHPVPLDGIMKLIHQVASDNNTNISYLDNLKVMLIQDDNDLATYMETIRQIIQDADFKDVNQGFADAISKCSESDLMKFIGDMVSLGIERGRLDYIPITVKFIRYFAEYNVEQEMFFERFVICNAYVSSSVLDELLIHFPELTPSDILDNLIRYDVNGGSVFGLSRIADTLTAKIGLEVLRKYLDLATESGKQEITMVLRDMVRKKMIPPVVDKFIPMNESGELAEYANILSLMESNKPITKDELDKYLGKYLAIEDVNSFNSRDIRALGAWSFIENSKVLYHNYGPLNTPNYTKDAEDEGIDVPYEPRLFFMRFNDIAYRLQEGYIDEDMMEDPFLSYNRDWFTGFCQYSQDVIPSRDHAYRRPAYHGGWTGCYGSPNSILLEMMQAYDVPMEQRVSVLQGVQDQFVKFFREVLGLEDNKLGFGYLTKNRIMLVSDKGTTADANDADFPFARMPKIVIRYAVERDEPSSYADNDGDMISYATGILSDIMGPGDKPMELFRDGGSARKFEKDVILLREDIIVYSLTKILLS